MGAMTRSDDALPDTDAHDDNPLPADGDAATDAADADHLPDGINRVVPAEQVVEVVGHRFAVSAQHLTQNLFGGCTEAVGAVRRVFGDRSAAVDICCQFGGHPSAGPLLDLALDEGVEVCLVVLLGVMEELIDIDAVVPHIDLGHRGVDAYVLSIAPVSGSNCFAAQRLWDVVVACQHDQARQETFEIPLERPGQGFVEIAKVEDKIALWRSPQPVIQDMGVSAHLNHDAGVRGGRQIVGHDSRGAAIVRPWGVTHPPVADGQKIGCSDITLGENSLQGIVPARFWIPGPEFAAGDQRPRLSAGCGVFGNGVVHRRSGVLYKSHRVRLIGVLSARHTADLTIDQTGQQ